MNAAGRGEGQRNIRSGIVQDKGVLPLLVFLISRRPLLLVEKIQQVGFVIAAYAERLAHLPDRFSVSGIEFPGLACFLVGSVIFRLGDQLAAFFLLARLGQFLAVAGIPEDEGDDLDTVLLSQGQSALVDRSVLKGAKDLLLDAYPVGDQFVDRFTRRWMKQACISSA